MRGKVGEMIITVAMAAALIGWSAPPAADLVIVRADGAVTVPASAELGYPAVPAAPLARALGYAFRLTTLDLDGEPVRFRDGSPFFTVGETVHQLPNPTYMRGRELMIPLSWVRDWLPRARVARWRYMDGRLIERTATASPRAEREGWLVVIDPGHGGPDPGTVGVRGTREKDITLAIGQQLARRLAREANVDVVLTRDQDTLIDLADRPRIPRIKGMDREPDLFLSIHGNSMPKKPYPTRGFETYFLAVAKTDEARRVALRENQAVRFEDNQDPAKIDPLRLILSDLRVTGNLQESNLLAHSVNRSLAVALEAPDLGVRQAPFLVLIGATIPAVLVEVGYLSNPQEERQLRSPSYQAKVADALADAVVNYLSEYGRRVWTSSAPTSGMPR